MFGMKDEGEGRRVAKLRERVRALERGGRLLEVLRREPLAEPFIKGALAVVQEKHPQWEAVHTLLAAQLGIEQDALLAPNLSNEAAQYNRGRVAGLQSFQETLLQAWARSQEADA